MKFDGNKDSGLFQVGELAEAKQFQSGFPLARSVPARFPVLTATLGHVEYGAFQTQCNSEPSFAVEAVLHPSARLLKITLQAGALRVHWLADENATELRAAIDVWKRTGEAAFAMWLPDGSPFNCLFGKLKMRHVFGTKAVAAEKNKAKSLDSWDILKAIIETGNALQDASTEHLGISDNRELVNIMLTNRIKKVAKNISASAMTDLLAERATGTVH